MKIYPHSYRRGAEIIPVDLQHAMFMRLSCVEVKPRRGQVRNVRAKIRAACTDLGFSAKLKVRRDTQLSISGVRDRTGLCLQTGNIARVYADLLKLEVLYASGVITAAVVVVLTRNLALALGQNLATFERLVRELEIFEGVVATPLLILGFEGVQSDV